MLSLARPAAHVDFAAESRRHLDALRAVVAAGGVIDGAHFEKRQPWKNPKHKRVLVGDLARLTKCAWCERHCEWQRQLDVEHYRPKAEVTRWDGSPPLVSDQPPRQVRVSDGYWWRAFDWDNYSLACGLCNQHWKRNLFPVRDPRPVHAEGMETQEVPLLLDPMSSFRTADHFSWTRFGEMVPVSDRGEATIITCGLNRSQLMELRRRTARNLLAEIPLFCHALRANTTDAARRHCLALAALCAPESEFAGMNRWWVERTLGWSWETLVEEAMAGR
jgi:hypothetical protein